MILPIDQTLVPSGRDVRIRHGQGLSVLTDLIIPPPEHISVIEVIKQ